MYILRFQELSVSKKYSGLCNRKVIGLISSLKYFRTTNFSLGNLHLFSTAKMKRSIQKLHKELRNSGLISIFDS